MEPEDPEDKDELDRRFDELDLSAYATDDELDAFAEGVNRYTEAIRPRKQARVLPPDLLELFHQVQDVAFAHRTYAPNRPFVNFEGYEVHDVRQGGMGLILKARDTTLDRWVAIKLWQNGSPEAQEALVHEARILAKFNHPNVVSVYGTGGWHDRVYFVMEWVDGLDGHEWMQNPSPWEEVREVFVPAGEGLAAAHRAGIQHRDFKPANMLLSHDTRVLVADFGVADSLDSLDPDQDEGKIVGTPSYMAPERLRGGRGDARSDQFSFCVALWRALYGQRPFGGDTRVEVLEQIERGELRGNPAAEVPDWLAAVARKGLSIDPDDRYASMEDLLDALIDEPSGGAETVDDRWLVGGGRGAGAGGPRVLHSPGWVGFLAGASLVGVGVVAVLSATPPPTQPLPPEPDAVQPEKAVAQPCAKVDQTLPPSSGALEVCGLIRRGYIDGAVAVWEQEWSSMRIAGATPELLGNDDLIIGATYIEYARSVERTDPSIARQAALESHTLTSRAAAQIPDGEALAAEFRDAADQLIRALPSAEH